MKRTVLVLCILSIVTICLAQRQLNGLYSIDLGNSLECKIAFYVNEKYEISISEKILHDITEICILSSGNYIAKGNQIVLHDSNVGFEMRCKQEQSDELKVTKGFAFLLFRTLKLYGISYEPKYNINMHSNLSPIQIKKEREANKRVHPDRYPLYYSRYINGDYVLEIQKEYKYALQYRGILLSEGIWIKEGNELLLSDHSLQYKYVVLTGKEGLIGKYLPGNFSNLILYEKNHPSPKKIVTIHQITHRGQPVTETIEKNEPFAFVEEMPQFPYGGEKAMLHFLKTNTHYPESSNKTSIKGKVILRCVIEKDGSISSVKVMRKLSPECDEEAMRVIMSMPKWVPGRHNGTNVAVKYTIAVDFGI
jgi:TonB family protein